MDHNIDISGVLIPIYIVTLIYVPFFVVTHMGKRRLGLLCIKVMLMTGTLSSVTFHATSPVSALVRMNAGDADPWKTDTPKDEGLSVAPSQEVTRVQEVAPAQNLHDTYVVQSGDNLWSIAEAHLDHGANLIENWKNIISVNSNTLRSENPNLIYPGEEILLG